jgi:hypothetical protein
MEVLAAVDDHRLAGDEVGGRSAQEDNCAHDVLRHLVSTPALIVKPGATQLTWIPSLPSSFASARVSATIAPFEVT